MAKKKAVRRLPKDRESFTDPRTLGYALRDAVKARGDLTHYELGKKAKVDPAAIGRFLSGDRDLTLDVASKLAKALGLRLVPSARKAKAGPVEETPAAD